MAIEDKVHLANYPRTQQTTRSALNIALLHGHKLHFTVRFYRGQIRDVISHLLSILYYGFLVLLVQFINKIAKPNTTDFIHRKPVTFCKALTVRVLPDAFLPTKRLVCLSALISVNSQPDALYPNDDNIIHIIIHKRPLRPLFCKINDSLSLLLHSFAIFILF